MNTPSPIRNSKDKYAQYYSSAAIPPSGFLRKVKPLHSTSNRRVASQAISPANRRASYVNTAPTNDPSKNQSTKLAKVASQPEPRSFPSAPKTSPPSPASVNSTTATHPSALHFKMTASESCLRSLVAHTKDNPDYYDTEKYSFEAVFECYFQEIFGKTIGRYLPFGRSQAEVQSAFERPLKAERNHEGRHPLYCGMSMGHAIAMDLASQLRNQYLQQPAVNIRSSWEEMWDSQFRELSSIGELFETILMPAKKEAEEALTLLLSQNPHIKNDHFIAQESHEKWYFLSWRDKGLAANTSLFGSTFSMQENCVCYWLKNHSHQNTEYGIQSFEDEIKNAFDTQTRPILEHIAKSQLGHRLDKEELIRKLVNQCKTRLAQMHRMLEGQKGGRLVGLYIDPDIIDKVVNVGNHTKLKIQTEAAEAHSPSAIFALARNNPALFEAALLEQAEIEHVKNPSCYSDPKDKLKGPYSTRIFATFFALPQYFTDEAMVKIECFDLFIHDNDKQAYSKIIHDAVEEFLTNLKQLQETETAKVV